jgi:hypothetical protein
MFGLAVALYVGCSGLSFRGTARAIPTAVSGVVAGIFWYGLESSIEDHSGKLGTVLEAVDKLLRLFQSALRIIRNPVMLLGR